MIGPDKKIKHLNLESSTVVEPLRLFITGGTVIISFQSDTSSLREWKELSTEIRN